MSRTIKLYKLPDTPQAALRPMTVADVPGAFRLVAQYLTKYVSRALKHISMLVVLIGLAAVQVQAASHLFGGGIRTLAASS